VDTLTAVTRIAVSTFIARPREEVWAEVERLEDHAEWMADARAVEFVGDQRRGIGTRMRVTTRVGLLRTTDVMEVTEWDPPRVIGVAHRGLVGGAGRFRLEPEGDGTRFEWSEDLRFPWFLGGPAGAFIARPILRGIWRRNLQRLKEGIE
jgi:carbon monoxide dehydrogenase subunit G